MAAAVVPTIKDKQFVNWLKGALAVFFTKQGLDDFVNDEMAQFHKDLLASIFQNQALPAGTVCNSCTIENVLACPTQNFCSKGRRCHQHDVNNPNKRPNQPCPKNICQYIKDGIHREHRYNGPSWKNTKAENWCTDAFDIAKCFLPPDGYLAVTTLKDTDFNGTLAVIINHKRFQNKMAAPLYQANNVCLQARDVGRKIRHSADLTVSDTDLIKYVDTLMNLLSDPKYLATDQKVQDAVFKLKQLKANTLTITTEDITTVIDDAIRESLKLQSDVALHAVSTARDETLEEIEHMTNESLQLLENTRSSIAHVQTVTGETLDKIIAEKSSAIDEIRMVVEEKKLELTSLGSKEMLKITERRNEGPSSIAQSVREYFRKRSLRKNMREDLISFYRKQHSTIPVSPLVQEHDVQLTDFYVQPPLTSVDVQSMFRSSQQPPTKIPIRSYRELFCRDNGKMYNDIYVTAKAGFGKTSFSKNLCITWCQAHSPVKEVKDKFKRGDLDAMRTFEFLFLVSLRDTETSECDVEKMITSNLLSCLKRHSQFSRRELEEILNGKTCLVLIDGLDEWTHSARCERGCRDVHAIPHVAAREQCTVMTTTRPWKYDVVKLGTSQIDRHIEISELNESTAKKLVSNAVSVLNRHTPPDQSKTIEEFEIATSTLKLDYLRNIPYILLQMICLWFDGKSIGRTKCKIYTNIIALTLSRGLVKLEKKASTRTRELNLQSTPDIPPCVQLSDVCKSHYDVLIALGKLAFEKLFSLKAESSLVFDRAEALSIIPEDILKFCLEIGFLSQTKDYGSVSERRSTLSFHHKSIQEFFAALYIQSCSDNKNIQECIRTKCNRLPAVLKMSNVFVFLAGLNYIACGRIFHIFTVTLSADEAIEQFRNYNVFTLTYIPRLRKYWEIMIFWQSMLIDSVNEIIANNEENNNPLYIEDLIVDRTISLDIYVALKFLTQKAKDKMKSLTISECRSAEDLREKIQALDLQGMQSLYKLAIYATPEEQDLYRLLSGSVDTLTCFVLTFAKFRNNNMYKDITTLSADTLGIVLRMVNLNILGLECMRLRHVDIQSLFQYLKNRQTMTYIKLGYIFCKDHRDQCEGYCLDLSRHKNIKELDLVKIPVSKLHVDVSSLDICGVGILNLDVQSSLLQRLPEAKHLTAVSFSQPTPEQFDIIKETLAKLTMLESVYIQETDLCETALILSPRMTILELVYLERVTMTNTSLRRLVDSVARLPQQVTIKLTFCTVKPEKDFNRLKKEISSSPNYQVLRDGLNERNIEEFSFLKLKSAT